MRLVDLSPKWLIYGGKRVGFTFISPVNPEWRQSCFAFDGFSHNAQMEMFGDDDVQPCSPKCAWHITGGIDNADFATITLTPSIDGSRGGLWHGHITNGDIVGGI